MELIKSTLLFLLLQVVAYTSARDIPDLLKKQAKKLHDMCQKEQNMDENLLSEILKTGKLSDVGSFKCYLHCIFDKVGLIDDQHMIHLENLIDVLPENLHEVINGLVASCGTKPGVDGCDTAFNTVKCYIEADPQFFAELSTVIA